MNIYTPTYKLTLWWTLQTRERGKVSKTLPPRIGMQKSLTFSGGRYTPRWDYNQEAIINRFAYNTCLAMAKFTELLPSDSWAKFSALV